jgi:hypothetical protein
LTMPGKFTVAGDHSRLIPTDCEVSGHGDDSLRGVVSRL